MKKTTLFAVAFGATLLFSCSKEESNSGGNKEAKKRKV